MSVHVWACLTTGTVGPDIVAKFATMLVWPKKAEGFVDVHFVRSIAESDALVQRLALTPAAPTPAPAPAPAPAHAASSPALVGAALEMEPAAAAVVSVSEPVSPAVPAAAAAAVVVDSEPPSEAVAQSSIV